MTGGDPGKKPDPRRAFGPARGLLSAFGGQLDNPMLELLVRVCIGVSAAALGEVGSNGDRSTAKRTGEALPLVGRETSIRTTRRRVARHQTLQTCFDGFELEAPRGG